MCRRHRTLLIVLMFGTGLLVLTNPDSVSACDFEEPPPPQEALDEAQAVFAGEVVSIEPVDDDPSDQFLAATFAVDRTWKGVETSPVIVETHQDEATCGFPFEEGEEYLVYAHSNGTPLTTALYHRTRLLERADEDLDALGSGTEVTAQTGNGDDNGQFNTGYLVLGAVILSIIAATVMLMRQSKPGLPENYDPGDDDDLDFEDEDEDQPRS